MIQFGIIRFGSVNDTEASVFTYAVFTRFIGPLAQVLSEVMQFCYPSSTYPAIVLLVLYFIA